jgi:hypothetical protein
VTGITDFPLGRCDAPRMNQALPALPSPAEPSLREELARRGILSEGERVRKYSKAWRLGQRSKHLADPLLNVPGLSDALGANESKAVSREVD